tara:strand:+ start:15257 stop:15862 length:606 start_codon:yes stop_codon:yes gene_type:complete
MTISKIDSLKGYMPRHEGELLIKWAKMFSRVGPLLEIGTFGGKAALYLGLGAKGHSQIVFTIDHHRGSEEHQPGQEYFDPENFDESLNRVNTVPLLQKNLNRIKEIDNVIPIIGNANEIAGFWTINLGLLFIDGSHTFKSANNDYMNWKDKIINGGALVIHDIFEDPHEGGQAPFEIFQKALKDGFHLYEKKDSIVCLIKG